jgi:site-specific recombinase XerD
MLVQKFIDAIKAKDRSKNTLNLLQHSVILCEKWLKKPLEDATYEDILKFIDHIKVKGMVLEGENRNEPLTKNSIWTVESKLIQFYAFCFNDTDDIKYNRMVKKLKSIKVDKPKNDIRPQDILFPEDIKKLINVATLERDRCLVAVLYEGGLRLGELLALQNNMIEMNEHSQEVTFHIPNEEGCKTGARSVLCLEVYGYVQDWFKCNPDTQFMPLSESGVQKAINKLFKRAGINKPSNPHMFRHSSITNAVIMKMQPNQISMRYWGIPNSNMLSVYLHLSEQIVNTGYRDAKGLGNGNGATVINPLAVRCVSCGRLIQSGELCPQCQENQRLRDEMGAMQFQNQKDFQYYDARIKQLESMLHDPALILAVADGLKAKMKVK